jgi:hypothetical protein
MGVAVMEAAVMRAAMPATPAKNTPTPSSVVISNVIYLVGAVALAAVVVAIVVLRHRRPTSVQSNMDTFHRGLAALAPGDPPLRRRPAPTSPHADSDLADNRQRPAGTVRPMAGGSAPSRPTSGAGSG